MGAWEIVLQDRVVVTFDLAEGESVVIGRGTDADVVVDNPAVSRRHARLGVQRGRGVLEDLGSANGSFVNGKKLAGPTPVGEGDRAEFGKFTLRLAAAPAPGRPGADLDATVFVKPRTSGDEAGAGPWLEARGGGSEPARLCLAGKRSARIGKGSFCDVRIGGWFVAQVQCTLVRRGGGWAAVPGGGFRSVRLNGRKISEETVLGPGDTLATAGVSLQVR